MSSRFGVMLTRLLAVPVVTTQSPQESALYNTVCAGFGFATAERLAGILRQARRLKSD